MNTEPIRNNQRRAFAIASLVTVAFVSAIHAEDRKPEADKGKTAPVAKTVSGPKVDIVPQARRRVAPVYPYDMLVAGRAGWAEVDFLVDHSGRAQLTSPHGSDREFALAMAAMAEASDFTPARKDNRAVMAPSAERYTFNGEASLDFEARRILTEIRQGQNNILPLNALAERPAPVKQVTPIYPRAMKSDKQTGQAEIEFIINREGRVLFPRIVSASHEDFGWAAATAVSQWRFQPPVKDGKKVDVRMRIPVIFDARQMAEVD